MGSCIPQDSPGHPKVLFAGAKHPVPAEPPSCLPLQKHQLCFYLIANLQGKTVADRIVRIKKGFDCRYQLGVNLKDSTHTVMEAMPHL